jgi:integrase
MSGRSSLQQTPTGHVFRVDRKRGPAWYAKYRLPDGRQVQRKIGPAWTERGRPAAGFVTKRLAEAWLQDTLGEARRGTLAGMVRTGATFDDAAAEFLRYIEHDRARKPETVKTYASIIRHQLLPVFGSRPVESITTEMVEQWIAGVTLAPASRLKSLLVMQGIFQRARRVYKLPANPLTDVERPPQQSSGDIDVFTPEEVWALVRAADSEQDAAIYLTAAFTGLRRGELVALRWRDVDFPASTIRVRGSYSGGSMTTPKSGRVRSVPMAPEVAEVLARLGTREHSTSDDDQVFIGVSGRYLDAAPSVHRRAQALGSAPVALP